MPEAGLGLSPRSRWRKGPVRCERRHSLISGHSKRKVTGEPSMDLVLDPPRGVAPVRLGMTLDEAVAAVSSWGEPKVHHRRHRESADISTSCDHVGIQVLLEGQALVTAVEVWWPGEGRESSTRVLLEGDDVFQTPADDILRRAADRGWTVDPGMANTRTFPASRWDSPGRPHKKSLAFPAAFPCISPPSSSEVRTITTSSTRSAADATPGSPLSRSAAQAVMKRPPGSPWRWPGGSLRP